MFDLVAVGGAKFERKNRRCATCWEAVVPRERLQCGAVSSRLRVYVWLLQPNKTHPIKLPLMMRLPDHISCKKNAIKPNRRIAVPAAKAPPPSPQQEHWTLSAEVGMSSTPSFPTLNSMSSQLEGMSNSAKCEWKSTKVNG